MLFGRRCGWSDGDGKFFVDVTAEDFDGIVAVGGVFCNGDAGGDGSTVAGDFRFSVGKAWREGVAFTGGIGNGNNEGFARCGGGTVHDAEGRNVLI